MNQNSTDFKGILRDKQAISFDVGFTLIYTEPPVGTVYAGIAADFGYRLDAGEVQDRFVRIWKAKSHLARQEKNAALANEEKAYRWWKEIFSAAVGETVSPQDLENMFHVCFNEYARGVYWRLYPDVLPALESLRAGGLRLAVLSNWDRRLLKTLNELHLDGYFEKIYISTLIGQTKPEAAAFQYVIDDLGISGQLLLHVGDTWEEDILGAQQAGIAAVWLNRPGKNKTAPGHRQVPVISSLAELLV